MSSRLSLFTSAVAAEGVHVVGDPWTSMLAEIVLFPLAGRQRRLCDAHSSGVSMSGKGELGTSVPSGTAGALREASRGRPCWKTRPRTNAARRRPEMIGAVPEPGATGVFRQGRCAGRSWPRVLRAVHIIMCID